MSAKWVYTFEEGTGEMSELLGGKGAGIAEMVRAGMPVPPGFTITTKVCRAYLGSGGQTPEGMWEQVEAALGHLEQRLGRRLGDPVHPLLLSIRSGARTSMPGMMDTVLNLGLNPSTLTGLARMTGDERFALDAYRRFIQLFGRVVMGVDGNPFEERLAAARAEFGVVEDSQLPVAALRALVDAFKALAESRSGRRFPSDPRTQLRFAVEAVFRSWNSDRAIAYRRLEHIPDGGGTAVNVQAMVFGNLGADSGTGVVFTRNPITGEAGLYGDFLSDAQGEDVVAGIRDTEPVAALARRMPGVYNELCRHASALERHYRDVQDLEFTVERGRLYMLQTRAAKRTGGAAAKIAVDLVREGVLSKGEAVLRVAPDQVEQALHPRVEVPRGVVPVARGVPASPGAAAGEVVFDPDTALAWSQNGRHVVLVRVETSPDDVHGMAAARGVLTSTGGTASHAALVARGLGVPCVVGASDVHVDLAGRHLLAGGATVREGEEITIDGTTGEVYLGRLPTIRPAPADELRQLLEWADGFRRLRIRANADYPSDARHALENGAEGIGLCRTEHMFMEQDRLPIVRAMVMAATAEERAARLAELLPLQRGDFQGLFTAMRGLPVVIRLIDPPLHEFLPAYDELVAETTELRLRGNDPERLITLERVRSRVEVLREANPMLGLRGVRLSILYPEIARMQVRAIMEAACAVSSRGVMVQPEIMVPLVGVAAELEAIERELRPVAEAVQREQGVDIAYRFGTMIEVPRAALTAGSIARGAEFFSFGTNDLTQMVFGFSRDDAEAKFIGRYLEHGILSDNPFETLDRDGVVRLMRLAVEDGRRERPGLEIGICGEHGGDARSIQICAELGLDYVSCSPYRVPVARVAAAHAALVGTGGDAASPAPEAAARETNEREPVHAR